MCSNIRCDDFGIKFLNLITALISICECPKGRRNRPSDRNPMATDERESCYFGVLNKIYLQKLLHGWVESCYFGVLNKIYLQNILH